jgi:hypothetical protein
MQCYSCSKQFSSVGNLIYFRQRTGARTSLSVLCNKSIYCLFIVSYWSELTYTKTNSKFNWKTKGHIHNSCSKEHGKRNLSWGLQTLESTFWSYRSQFLVHHIFEFAIIWRRARFLFRRIKRRWVLTTFHLPKLIKTRESFLILKNMKFMWARIGACNRCIIIASFNM